MAITKKTTKDKILELIKKEVKLTVTELTVFLNITDMAVRKHLTAMEKDGLITSREAKQPMGRPIQLYSLSEKGELLFPKNYEGLSVEFLKDIEDLHGEASIHQLFRKREKRLTEEYAGKISGTSSDKKMEEMLAIQNDKGYMAEVTQLTENTFELTEYNCPIMAIANEYKVACQCETSMFKEVLQTENVKRTTCKTNGDDHCRFMIEFQS